MGLFEIIRKKIRENKDMNKSVDDFDKLWEIGDISEIFQIENPNNLIVSIYGLLSKKCENGKKIGDLNSFEKTIYLCQVFEGEINNGGFSQFFYNSSGDFSMETIEALSNIGAFNTSDLLKKACSIFPAKIAPQDRNYREDLLEKIPEKFSVELLGQLDEEFYKYEDDLLKLNYDFVQKNKSEFS